MKPVENLSDEEFAQLAQRSVSLLDAPPALLRAALALLPADEPAALKAVAGSALRLVAAVLRFDGWSAQPPAFGTRSAKSDTRHLLFSAKGRDIDLRINPAADAFALTGQVLGPDEAGLVELAEQSGDAAANVAELDDLGEFRLDGVRGGTYRLTLRVGNDEIVLSPIVVGERPT